MCLLNYLQKQVTQTNVNSENNRLMVLLNKQRSSQGWARGAVDEGPMILKEFNGKGDF